MTDSNVLALDDRMVRLSIARLAEAFGMSRATVSSRLAKFGVKPDGERRGYPIYRLRDAAPALVAGGSDSANGDVDPATLPPLQRNHWYQSEIRRLDVEMSAGRLIPVAQVEAEMADMTRDFVQFLQVLPDQLERDCGLAPDQVERMHESVDQQRQAFYERLVTEDEPECQADAET